MIITDFSPCSKHVFTLKRQKLAKNADKNLFLTKINTNEPSITPTSDINHVTHSLHYKSKPTPSLYQPKNIF